MHTKLPSAILLTALFLSLPLTAQQKSGFGESIDVGYVLVPFVPRDEEGRPVLNLTRGDVKLKVDGTGVAPDMFERIINAPVSFTILLDLSGSMALGGKIAGARSAIEDLLVSSQKGDDFSLYTFSAGEVRLVVPFSSDASQMRAGLKELAPYGQTAFFDALARMPDKTLLGKNGSRAIVVFTDGFDNASSLSRTELTNILEGVDVPVYPLGLRADPGEPAQDAGPAYTDALQDVQILHEIARITGGRAAFADEPQELRIAVAEIMKELRLQYLLGFKPTGRGRIQYRKISLEVPRRVRSVHIRGGYRGTEPPLQTRSGSRAGRG